MPVIAHELNTIRYEKNIINAINIIHFFSGTGSNTDLLVMHGSTDAPTVDVKAGGNTLVDDIDFGDYNSSYLELPTNDYVLDITDAAGSNTVASYSADLQTLNLDGEAITVVASGFLTPASNSNGPAFGLYAATAAGGNLVALPVYTNISDKIFNKKDITIWPNPVSAGMLNIKSDFTTGAARLTIYDVTGKTIRNTSYSNQVNIAGLVSGVYTLTISEDDKYAFRTFVVE